jgi:diamine N-acetyltransferase
MATFRDAELSDVGLLLRMMRQLYDNDGVNFDEETSRRSTLLLLEEPRAGRVMVMEEEEGVACGYVVLTYGFSLEYGGWHGFIDELFIEAPYRGRGLGSEAVRRVQAECAQRGMPAVLLEADLKNEKATRLYERLGFRETARRLMVAVHGR